MVMRYALHKLMPLVIGHHWPMQSLQCVCKSVNNTCIKSAIKGVEHEDRHTVRIGAGNTLPPIFYLTNASSGTSASAAQTNFSISYKGILIERLIRAMSIGLHFC